MKILVELLRPPNVVKSMANETAPTAPTSVDAEKCTIYVHVGFGYRKIECRRASVSRRKYAQYDNAVEYRYVEKGKRKERGATMGSNPRIVMLAGWGHPEPSDRMEDLEGTANVAVRRTRHSCFSEEWNTEFNAFLEAYKTRENPTILVDIREA